MAIDAFEEAQQASEDLRAALAAHGIMLPALGVDVPAVIAGFPLVSLGCASAATVRQIVAALHC